MKSVLISDEVAARLERRAALHGRDLQAEHQAVLEQALESDTGAPAESTKRRWIERARHLRQEVDGRLFTPSEDLLRELRDEH